MQKSRSRNILDAYKRMTFISDRKGCRNLNNHKLRFLLIPLLTITLLTGCKPSDQRSMKRSTGVATAADNHASLKEKVVGSISDNEDGAITHHSNMGVEQGGSTTLSQNRAQASGDGRSTPIDELVKVHFIDVGQADSIFIDYGDVDVLLDGGNNADGALVVDYLKALGTDDIELMIATHPHEDHIGGLDTVINQFSIERVLKPDIAEMTQTNKAFENAITSRNIPYESPEQGKVFEFDALKIQVLNDKNKSYNHTNNYSIVVKMTYGDNSFLFTGDAESDAEHDILNSGLDIKADVLKVGHHGSASSTTAQFLNKIKPDYAVISVGADNRYGHPDNIITNRLNLQDVATMRTDEMGTVIFSSDGSTLSFETKKAGIDVSSSDNQSSSTSNSGVEPSVVTNSSSKPTGTPTLKPTEIPVEPTTSPPSAGRNPDTINNGNVEITSLDKRAELITLTNTSGRDIHMTGWYIVSVTGNQTFYFPDGYVLEAGKIVTVASGDVPGDLHWTKANVWNNSKSDPAELYNISGELVDKWDD